MKTTVTTENPFGWNRYGFLWEVLRSNAPGKHLDFGAYDGKIVSTLRANGVVREAIGTDVNSDVVNTHKDRMPRSVRLVAVSPDQALPFEDCSFHSVSMLDVLEHLHDQQSAIREIHRVLKADGLLVLTLPKKHIFSFLDTGNLKFIFPRVHKIYYSARYSRRKYEERYVECRHGLVGDIDARKAWHEHFSKKRLLAILTNNGFAVESFDGSGLFLRPLGILRMLSPRLVRRFLKHLLVWDAKLFASANLFCVGRAIKSS